MAAVPEKDWTPISYPDVGQAQAAETVLHTPGRPPLRLIVRRTGPAEPKAELQQAGDTIPS